MRIETVAEPTQTDADPRFVRAHKALAQALIALVDENPSEPISITRLVEAAGVTRPTFYQHFADVGAALQQVALERVGEAFPSAPRQDDGRPIEQQVHDYILPPLQHLDEHRLFYLRVIETAASIAFFEELVRLIQQRMRSLPHYRESDLSDVVAAGAMWMVVRWLRGTVTGTPGDIARRIAALGKLVHQGPEGQEA